MNFLKLIFLVILLIDNVYSAAQWPEHANLVQMSWPNHFLDQFRRMETHGGAHELNAGQRQQVLRSFAAGHDNADVPIPEAPAPLPGYVTQELINFLEAGKISAGDANDYRDRKRTGGWLLNTMDIIRQQAITNDLFDHHGGLANNDLMKVDGLSGTFWQWEGNDESVPFESFSGMIQPDQHIAGTVDILSCFHGVWGEQLNEYYFLPKGLDPVAENFYPIREVHLDDPDAVAGEALPIAHPTVLNQARIDRLSAAWNADAWGDLFQRKDHVIIRVSNNPAAGHQTLAQYLNGKGLANAAHQVVNLAGANAAAFNPTRVFAYGKPGHDFIQNALEGMYPGWDGFCLVSDLVGHDIVAADLQAPPLLVHPLRRHGHPEYVAPAPTPLAHRLALPIPTSAGMSGGPVLRCEIAAGHIHCRLLGVVHGSNLIQEGGHLFFKGLIATH